jgi:hypothetical protein
MQGPISFRPGSVEEWTSATLNYPLYNGDHLWADMGGRAELHVGSTAIRLSSETALAILNLDDRMVQLSLTGGLLNVHLRALGQDESFEIDTPNSAVTLLRPGDYRFQVDENNASTTVTVHGGDAEITGGGRSFAVHPRDSARITGMDDTLSSEVTFATGFDGFDRWCQDRDRREEQSQSARYVGREMIGYEDLDEHGVWTQSPDYGWVWRPRVLIAGWAPYRYGHWAWVEPWGWTWIDGAPWGFAPFHYGRWAMYGGGWVWVPGAVVARPVYAPALVAFVSGPRFSMAVSFGGRTGVAWFPLGPHEIYRPAYHVSEVYIRQVNMTHVTVTNLNVTNVNVTNVRYVNQSVSGAVTVVPQATFVGARAVHASAVVVPAGAMAQAQVVGSSAPVAPGRISILGRPAPVGRVAAPPPRMMDRAVVARTTPPPPPVSFTAKAEALMANPGRPIDARTAETLRRLDTVPRPPMVRSAAAGGMQQPASPTMPNRPAQPMQPVMRDSNGQPSQPPRNHRPSFRPQASQLQNQQPESQQPRTFVRTPAQQLPSQSSQPQSAQPARLKPPQEVQQARRDERKQEQQERKVERQTSRDGKKEEKKQ